MKLSELNLNGKPISALKEEKPILDRRITQVITDFRIAGVPDKPVSLVICMDGTKWMLVKGATELEWRRVADIPTEG